MDDNVFVLLDDPLAPTRADVLAAAPPGQEAAYLQGPTHFRTTFLTLKPPGALEQLLAQLKARWVSVRQSSSNGPQRGQSSGHQLWIDGHQYAIGNDWLVRVGNVCLPGGGIKGMVLEAEYLPLPVLHSPVADGTSELLSNLLTSILPNIKDAKTVAVTISDSQWDDVLWDREQEEKNVNSTEGKETSENLEDIYAYGDEDIPEKKDKDWVGIDRDRSATVIPSLSLGLSLSSRFLPPDQLDPFMRRMLVSRISRRVLAEHHIALSEIHAGTHAESSGEPHVGIIFTGLNVRKSVERCVRLLKARPISVEDHYGNGVLGTGWPEVIIDGHLDTKFAYIREHLE
ncbi:hypothetical protein H0H87_002603 [Tephrocybe sp. NHM501043]|nr:hypothetical protein H0H87_002603 [Tephrocybe sp. NHM501043]